MCHKQGGVPMGGMVPNRQKYRRWRPLGQPTATFFTDGIRELDARRNKFTNLDDYVEKLQCMCFSVPFVKHRQKKKINCPHPTDSPRTCGSGSTNRNYPWLLPLSYGLYETLSWHQSVKLLCEPQIYYVMYTATRDAISFEGACLVTARHLRTWQ